MTSTAVARRQDQSVAAYRDSSSITNALRAAAEQANLVSPATVVGSIPLGSEVVLSAVMIDAREIRDGGDCYKLSGKLGLGKTALDRIASAAGVSWDPHQTGRLDDGSDPHYCHFRAVGHVQDLDGTMRTISGEVEMDAREGSPQLDEIREKARKSDNAQRRAEEGASQIRELRKFLIRHAESKAKNRAIRSLGVKTAYTPADLRKPFQVAKLMWTGRTGDPSLDRELALRTLDHRMGATRMLYGDRTATEIPRAALPAAPIGHAPPPVGDVYDTEAYDDGPDFHGAGEDMHPDTEPEPVRREEARQPEPQEVQREGIDTTQVRMPGKGDTCLVSEAEDKDLEWWAGTLRDNIDDPNKSRFRDSNVEKLAAIEAEIGYRRQERGEMF